MNDYKNRNKSKEPQEELVIIIQNTLYNLNKNLDKEHKIDLLISELSETGKNLPVTSIVELYSIRNRGI